jgi:hypothetical protein
MLLTTIDTINIVPSLYTLVPTNLLDDKGNIIYKKYFPPPPISESTYIYQDINKDENLRNQVISFFCDKMIKWSSNDEQKANFYKSYDGKKKINKILRNFVKIYNYNWYDLIENYKKVKKYIYKHLDD